MSDLTAAIRALDDNAAERILGTVAKHRLQPGPGTVTALTPELADALADTTGAPAPATATPGELARTTLLLLAEDPARQPELQALVSNPPAQRYVEPVTLIALGTVALIALQTYVKIEYDAKKGCRIKIEKKPADNSVLGQLIGLLKTLAAHP
jgi:hypothetical protein